MHCIYIVWPNCWPSLGSDFAMEETAWPDFWNCRFFGNFFIQPIEWNIFLDWWLFDHHHGIYTIYYWAKQCYINVNWNDHERQAISYIVSNLPCHIQWFGNFACLHTITEVAVINIKYNIPYMAIKSYTNWEYFISLLSVTFQVYSVALYMYVVWTFQTLVYSNIVGIVSIPCNIGDIGNIPSSHLEFR